MWRKYFNVLAALLQPCSTLIHKCSRLQGLSLYLCALILIFGAQKSVFRTHTHKQAHMPCPYLYETEDVEDVVESQDAVIHSHQTTQPGGGGDQQQQEGTADSGTAGAQREREENTNSESDSP